LRENRDSSKVNKSEHNKEVNKIANEYQKKGYLVKADLKGYSKPPALEINSMKCLPDVWAEKGKEIKMIEVETCESFKPDKEQRECFKKFAKSNYNTSFETIITGKCDVRKLMQELKKKNYRYGKRVNVSPHYRTVNGRKIRIKGYTYTKYY